MELQRGELSLVTALAVRAAALAPRSSSSR